MYLEATATTAFLAAKIGLDKFSLTFRAPVSGFQVFAVVHGLTSKRISGNAPPPLITHEQEKECLPNLFILATAYKPPTSLPCLDATESTGYLTACMSSVASVSASLPCFVDGGQGTKQKADLWRKIGFLRCSREGVALEGRWFPPENNLLIPLHSTN